MNLDRSRSIQTLAKTRQSLHCQATQSVSFSLVVREGLAWQSEDVCKHRLPAY